MFNNLNYFEGQYLNQINKGMLVFRLCVYQMKPKILTSLSLLNIKELSCICKVDKCLN